MNRNRIFKYNKYLKHLEHCRYQQIIREYANLDNFIISIINTTVQNTRANKNGYGLQVDYSTIYKKTLWKNTRLQK